MISDVIEKNCQTFGLDFKLIRAIVLTESGGKSSVARYEAQYIYTFRIPFFATKCGISQDTETQLQKMSWGPMQVMGGLARQLGFDGFLPDLCKPDVGIYYGCKYLKSLKSRYSLDEDTIAAYNAGSPRRKADGGYVNQDYVNKVKGNL